MTTGLRRDLTVTIVGDADSLGRALGRGRKDLNLFGRVATSVGQGVGLALGFQATQAVGSLTRAITTGAIGAAINWESEWANVRKTVDASEADLARIEDRLRSLSLELPTSAEELARIAAEAGQLGIEAPNIVEFTRTVALLKETTNLDAPAASLARFLNITGSGTEIVGQLGSVIVDLGNNSATTEQEILNTSLRIAAAGRQARLSEPEILAIAAAMSSTGLEAEAGGSAMSRFLAEMVAATTEGGPRLQAFAEIAGVSGDEFRRRFAEEPAAAIQLVLAGLSTGPGRGRERLRRPGPPRPRHAAHARHHAPARRSD